MLARPRDLADRMAGMPRSETFTLPIDTARLKPAKSSIDLRKAATQWSLSSGGSFQMVGLSSRRGTCGLRDGTAAGRIPGRWR